MTREHGQDTQPDEHAVSPVKRAVLYLRVSTQSQVDTAFDPEGNSIPSQRVACTRRAAELGAQIVAEYVEPGRSAMNVEGRPRFREMMARISNERDVDYVIVYARSRMHRDGIDAAITKRDLRDAGVVLVSVMDYTDDTYVGGLIAHIIDGVNEYQSRASGPDIAYKMQAKAERGGTLGIAKLGYRNVREKVDGREIRTIATDTKRAPFIRMLFELYATGTHSFHALRDAVTKAGLRTRPTKKNPAGTMISISKIGVILRDRYYLGYVTYKGNQYQGQHEPLITQELFDRVQHVLDTQRSRGTRKCRHNHHLKGIVWCGRCRKRLIYQRGLSSSGRAYYYFVCAARMLHKCGLPRLPAAHVEHEVEKHLATLRIPPSQAEQLRTAIAKAITTSQASTTAIRRSMTTELKRLRALQTQYLDLVGHPDWPQDTLTTKMRDLTLQKADLRKRLAEADTTDLINGQQTITTLLDLLTDPQTFYRNIDDDTKTFLVRASCHKLFVNVD